MPSPSPPLATAPLCQTVCCHIMRFVFTTISYYTINIQPKTTTFTCQYLPHTHIHFRFIIYLLIPYSHSPHTICSSLCRSFVRTTPSVPMTLQSSLTLASRCWLMYRPWCSSMYRIYMRLKWACNNNWLVSSEFCVLFQRKLVLGYLRNAINDSPSIDDTILNNNLWWWWRRRWQSRQSPPALKRPINYSLAICTDWRANQVAERWQTCQRFSFQPILGVCVQIVYRI